VHTSVIDDRKQPSGSALAVVPPTDWPSTYTLKYSDESGSWKGGSIEMATRKVVSEIHSAYTELLQSALVSNSLSTQLFPSSYSGRALPCDSMVTSRPGTMSMMAIVYNCSTLWRSRVKSRGFLWSCVKPDGKVRLNLELRGSASSRGAWVLAPLSRGLRD
jgi:hypothetical protein